MFDKNIDIFFNTQIKIKKGITFFVIPLILLSFILKLILLQ
jgi:hypothetical protein